MRKATATDNIRRKKWGEDRERGSASKEWGRERGRKIIVRFWVLLIKITRFGDLIPTIDLKIHGVLRLNK